MNSIIYFTKYTEKGPSSRYRSYQYKSYLEKDFNLQFYSLFNDDYIDNLYGNKGQNYFQLFKAYFVRILQVLKCLGTDKIVFIEYELLPYFPPIFEYLLYKSKVKVILDYDDAIFHSYDLHSNFIIRSLFKNKLPNIAKKAKCIITGSPYLTSFFLKYNENVVEIPTSIIFKKYVENYKNTEPNDTVRIGWIGSKSTSLNLIFLGKLFDTVLKTYPKVTFNFMGCDPKLFNRINSKNVQFFEWSESDELPFLSTIDIGIMPLQDTLTNRGKCGFKLIQYMAMGKPTISTPLEANVKINRNSNNFFANNDKEWFLCISEFMKELNFFKKNVGNKNRKIVENYYSVEVNYLKYIKLFGQITD